MVMNIKEKISQIFGRESQELRQILLADKVTAETIEKARSLIIQLEQSSKDLTKKDIGAWRDAHKAALQLENPNRRKLYDIYDFTTYLDSHVEGVALRIRTNLKQKKFRLVAKKTNEENKELTEHFEQIWFKDLLDLITETKFYGHSLVQFGSIINIDGTMQFENVELVPRRHVIPEYGVIIKEQSDEPAQGFDYRKGSLADWSLEIGKKDNLGCFLKASPKAISKKYVEIFWDNFAEKFGVPILYANSESRNDEDNKSIKKMLSSMGSSAWGLFPAGTKLEMIETSKGDAYMVFDKRIERCDQQISKCMAGQTMAFDDGASRSQGETHLVGFDEIMASYSDDARDFINNRLLPFMVRHGFALEGYRFDWDDTYEFTPKEIQTTEAMLLQHYEINPEYFIKRYNIDIIGKKENPSPNVKLTSQPYPDDFF